MLISHRKPNYFSFKHIGLFFFFFCVTSFLIVLKYFSLHGQSLPI